VIGNGAGIFIVAQGTIGNRDRHALARGRMARAGVTGVVPGGAVKHHGDPQTVASGADVALGAGVGVVAGTSIMSGHLYTRARSGIAHTNIAGVVQGRAVQDQGSAGTGSSAADITPGAGVGVITAAAILQGNRHAGACEGIALSGIAAVVEGGAVDGQRRAGTGSLKASIRGGAGILVITEGAIRGKDGHAGAADRVALAGAA